METQVVVEEKKPEVKELPLLVENPNRIALTEGRNYGVAFAFTKRDGNKYHGLWPLSCCKDYPNDTCYTEATGREYSAYGYHAKPTKCFEDGVGHMAIGILRYFPGDANSSAHTNYRAEIDHLAKHHKNIEAFMVQLDKLLKLDQQTVITPFSNENRYLVEMPKFYTEMPYRCSMYLLFLRVAIESLYKEGDARDAIAKCKTGDSIMACDALNKFNKMVEGKCPVQDWTRFNHARGIYDMGINLFV